ncbi:MAG: malate synthase A [Elusimicrobia bacterium]|nr:malate synthase A [Elusimicrobiota bacterium]
MATLSPSFSDLERDGIRLASTEASADHARILTPEALRFVAGLQKRFGAARQSLLSARDERQARLDAGELPEFPRDTQELRASAWKVAPIPKDLLDRRVEITGPVDRKMVINALNSGAKVYMADFEDSHSPVWSATVQGQANLYDAVRRTIQFASPKGKRYTLNPQTATLMVRPRGWHLLEKHMLVDGKPVSGSLFDFGLFFFHNAKELLSRGTGPYFYLPKIESRLEARLWNDVFAASQKELGIPNGTVKATFLIETILAAFEMDEILYELRDHSAGLNCGRWDYIFSFIKKFSKRPEFVLPDRAQVGMTSHFLRSYSRLLIRTCHRRGAHGMGGMAAQIPIKNDPAANDAAMAKVRADKEREVGDGHDGTWVAHPGLVATAREIFDRGMPGANQIERALDPMDIAAKDLLEVPRGEITEGGLRTNLNVGVQYLAAWLSGSGCVPLYNLMEDAATAEISRAQVWQWVRHQSALSDGRKVTMALVRQILKEELSNIRASIGDDAFGSGNYAVASELFDEMIAADTIPSFLTLSAYDRLP